jgi:protein-S-isoprenylcysteine O-methyltransferase Ste14
VELTSYFILLAFILLTGKISWLMLRQRLPKNHILGRPTIVPLQFYFGKGTMAVTWFLFIMKSLFPAYGYLLPALQIKWISVVLLYIGMFILISGLISLGASFRMGLPENLTELKTNGIYRFSRNPIYLGAYLISIASCLYFPDLVNFSFTVYSLFIHHQIIRKEEQFMTEKFGTPYLSYCSCTRRYV